MRGFEERLGMRLLTRTTRSVTTTEAGERLPESVGPALDQIEAELSALSAFRDKPAGSVRITDEHAVGTVLMPALKKVLPQYPDITVELVIDPHPVPPATGIGSRTLAPRRGEADHN